MSESGKLLCGVSNGLKSLLCFVYLKGKQGERGYLGEPGKQGEKVRTLHRLLKLSLGYTLRCHGVMGCLGFSVVLAQARGPNCVNFKRYIMSTVHLHVDDGCN